MGFAHRFFVCFSVLPSLLLASSGLAQIRTSLIPAPQQIIPGKAVNLTRQIVVVNNEAGFGDVVDAFKEDWTIGNFKKGRVVEIRLDKKLDEESYQIDFGSTIKVTVSTRTGLAWALQTLGQSINADPMASHIGDYTFAPFRCVTLDVARRFHSISTLKTMARWCQLGKVRYMQLHLTDDQNWMLPSDVVSHVDSRNQHHLPAYTVAELKELQAFASARGVTIVPEIDIPGHSSLLVASDPGLFKIQNSPSGGCVNFGSPLVRAKLKQLIGETARLFAESPFIHIGGDEAWYPDAEKDPLMKEAMARLGPNSNPSEVFVDFVGEMADEVIRLKKKPIVWEGFAASDFAKKRIPKDTVVVAWEGTYYPPDKLISDGYQVVNAGWDPYYVVNHFPYESYTVVP
ncbi:MAG: family 20 glycosylhydrolase, partial [Armatimonadota bacterium]